MKWHLFEKLEEKIVYKTSHVFFLSLTGIVLLAMVVSLFLLLWGLTPSLKPSVEKAEYPPPVTVSLAEITRQLPVEKAKAANKTTPVSLAPVEKAASKKSEPVNKTIPDSTKLIYEQKIARMKELLPPKKYLWPNKGHYTYWKRWVVDAYGIQSRLDNRFDAVDASSYTDKVRLLDSYINILQKFTEKQRYGILRELLNFTKGTVEQTLHNMALLVEATTHFSNEKSVYLTKLARFGRKNPRDGQAFIAYVNRIITRFNAGQREAVLDNMIATYYNLYNDIKRQKEATERFLPFIPKIEPQYQANALSVFYKTFEEKNRNWRAEISRIDNQYDRDMRAAEMMLMEKKAAKAEYRKKALVGLGGGIVFIAIVALILSLLSIQRNIAELRKQVAATPEHVALSPRENAIKVKSTL